MEGANSPLNVSTLPERNGRITSSLSNIANRLLSGTKSFATKALSKGREMSTKDDEALKKSIENVLNDKSKFMFRGAFEIIRSDIKYAILIIVIIIFVYMFIDYQIIASKVPSYVPNKNATILIDWSLLGNGDYMLRVCMVLIGSLTGLYFGSAIFGAMAVKETKRLFMSPSAPAGEQFGSYY